MKAPIVSMVLLSLVACAPGADRDEPDTAPAADRAPVPLQVRERLHDELRALDADAEERRAAMDRVVEPPR